MIDDLYVPPEVHTGHPKPPRGVTEIVKDYVHFLAFLDFCYQ